MLENDPAAGDVLVRFIRAERCQGWTENYAYWEAAFQFPYYPGFNLRIFFDECMQDLAWMPADHYVTVATNANLLLRNIYPEFFIGFLRSLEDIATFWNRPHDQHANYGMPFSSNALSFHVVFQCEESAEEDLFHRYSAASIQFTDITKSMMGG